LFKPGLAEADVGSPSAGHGEHSLFVLILVSVGLVWRVVGRQRGGSEAKSGKWRTWEVRGLF
jgi:hypothetical protein